MTNPFALGAPQIEIPQGECEGCGEFSGLFEEWGITRCSSCHAHGQRTNEVTYTTGNAVGEYYPPDIWAQVQNGALID